MSHTPLQKLRALHRAVDTLATRVAQQHGDRLKCGRGCSACCLDGLTVFDLEADNIVDAVGESLRGAEPSLRGCVFLDNEGACRVYTVRPYVCRTQGLPLRWFEEDEDDDVVEFRDICELNAAGPPLDGLPEEACWTIGHVEMKLQDLQLEHGDDLTRTSLRDVFERCSKA